MGRWEVEDAKWWEPRFARVDAEVPSTARE
jgi:hypothetical protein